MSKGLNIASQLTGKHILVTGGAGFIGSNITRVLLEHGAKVRVFDNLATGKKQNLEAFRNMSSFEFMEGDLRLEDDCAKAVEGIDAVCHQGALGSVPRSIAYPHQTHAVNATGFLNMMHASHHAGIKRFVFASSSSVYGDSTVSPKYEGAEGQLLSPYAVTKQLNEEYARVYHRLHGTETIGLRYFNVFGPNQDPEGVYAAAIPRFIAAMMQGGEIIINGDGSQTRDFTYVKNAVYANILALTTTNEAAFGKAFNVACGDSFSLNEMIEMIRQELTAKGVYHPNCKISNGPPRAGDIMHSLADIANIQSDLAYEPLYQFAEGIREYLAQY